MATIDRGAIVTEQKRSLIREDPRVPLAAERTFLAWIRTGLALMGFGFVVARFGLFLRELEATQHMERHSGHGVSLWLGIALVLFGVFLNLAALARHRRYLRQLGQGILPETKPWVETVVAVTLALLGLVAVFYLTLEIVVEG
jgi:putative membrane protein